MKKILSMLMALSGCLSAYAFEFDGIDLNADLMHITRQVSSKGYTYDIAGDCLKGTCQGTEITLKFNTENVSTKNKLGQLIVNIPMNEAAYGNATMLFNVIYHLEEQAADHCTYSVSADGTQLTVQPADKGIKLIYTTPYMKK